MGLKKIIDMNHVNELYRIEVYEVVMEGAPFQIKIKILENLEHGTFSATANYRFRGELIDSPGLTLEEALGSAISLISTKLPINEEDCKLIEEF